MSEIVAAGLVLGLSAGFAPGPLMTLVLMQSLKHGVKEGLKTSLVPLMTDLPVILLSLWFTAQASRLRPLLGVISLAGGLFVLRLAWQSLRPSLPAEDASTEPPRSWQKGLVTNFLSPNPWLFWFTVGAATVLKARQVGWDAVLVFFVIFYLLLCGIKALMAVVAGKGRAFLRGRAYRLVLQTLGVALAVFALSLFWEAWKYLGRS
ncbi:LysE family translocator [Fontisphaera persica]|uniref:LysE family translocator n=1 Tax=Fontisphaera persica TaxID=2974023 RepID=UPI0024BF9EBD|nr:LysE family translocator [Fontisphaera persica]WCJ61178.1 LysE family translocator [Fontisphaera persica]